ncbi:peptide chain release factor N(5)-glutamine methyltransferase [Frankia sp. Cr2]|uniref:peptide chain release factor N(5)-glutamine methyltransferase n=1 Tax=Frankia sp. Cr2 TaxID=3073932 RepID=UPI003A0FF906
MGPVVSSVRAAVAALAAAGVASPRSDAEELAAYVTGEPRRRLPLTASMTPADLERFAELVARRVARVPLQHLVGTVGFRYLTLAVGPGVFIPRPETETVVGWALDAVRAAGWTRPVCVDLCTGSGAIALALAEELPGARVHAVERDPGALAWAARNIAARGFTDADGRVTLHHADVGIEPAGCGIDDVREPVATVATVARELADLFGRVDLVVSNPPYLWDDERDLVEPEVGKHDPPAALWAGPDGLAGVRAVAQVAGDLLRDGGQLVIEHSDRHGLDAPALLHASGYWDDVRDHPDLAGRARFVSASRRPRTGTGTGRYGPGREPGRAEVPALSRHTAEMRHCRSDALPK